MKRNPIAKALRSSHLKPKVFKNKKAYCRKEKYKVNLKNGATGSPHYRFMGLMAEAFHFDISK